MKEKEFRIEDLNSKERANLRKRLKGILNNLDSIEEVPGKSFADSTESCTCTSCDCDPGDGSQAKASYHFGKNLAGL